MTTKFGFGPTRRGSILDQYPSEPDFKLSISAIEIRVNQNSDNAKEQLDDGIMKLTSNVL
jgi:hypothetical protein